MFISLTIVKFIATSAARFWNQAIATTIAMLASTTVMIVATLAMLANSTKEHQCLVFVGEEFSFGHNKENPAGAINVDDLDINLDASLGNLSESAISYRLGQDFRSGRYRRNLRFACT